MPRRLFVLAGAAAVLAAGCVKTTVMPQPRAAAIPSMVVSGLGTVQVRPDTLVVSLGISSERDTATAALEAVGDGAKALIAAVRSEGVARPDVRTESLGVRPNFDDTGSIDSYIGNEAFRIEIHDLSKAGVIVGKAVDAVGDDIRINGMSLEVSDKQKVLSEARQRAVADALSRARELTDAAGIDLGSPINVAEGRATPFPVFRLPIPAATSPSGVFAGGSTSTAGGVAADNAIATAVAAPRIEPGTHEIQVRVSVRFELNQKS